jgi:hypothetical protein
MYLLDSPNASEEEESEEEEPVIQNVRCKYLLL